MPKLEPFNQLSRKVSQNSDVQILYDRLLWLRNHYDLYQHDKRNRVLTEIDTILYAFDEIITEYNRANVATGNA